MSVFFNKKAKVARLELTPLIDIIFILLLFFAVSTSLITNKDGINLQLPEAESIHPNKEGIILSIDTEQILFLNKTPITIDQIQPAIKKLLFKDQKSQIIINAHRATPYHLVIKVMDNIRLAGCFDIVLQAEKEK
jgi:biopolymer transport protein ExbD